MDVSNSLLKGFSKINCFSKFFKTNESKKCFCKVVVSLLSVNLDVLWKTTEQEKKSLTRAPTANRKYRQHKFFLWIDPN